MHLVGHRQSLGRLHQRQDELPVDAAVLGVAEVAHIAIDYRLAVNLDRREVVEHDRKLLIDQRAHEKGEALGDGRRVSVQHVHGAQQLLMLGQPIVKAESHRQSHGLEPAQHAELGGGVAQTIEHHRPQAGEHLGAGLRTRPRERQAIEVQRRPQLPQGPHIARSARIDEAHILDGDQAAGGAPPLCQYDLRHVPLIIQ